MTSPMSAGVQAETGVLFEPISAKCRIRPLLIAANQPFSVWHGIFPDETTAVRRFVHRATILEMNAGRCRHREELKTAGCSGQKTTRR